ncbi:MAG: DNA polymerase II large subunit, partial [Candidatus Thermoplasmatota archaeon]|nr:DNA polymerase II large subunit [Candidatus Thermoplasmatota archaeon]
VKQIVDLGEILIPYGEFIENNALLPDSSYVIEWWIQDLQKTKNYLPKENTAGEIHAADAKLQQKINDECKRKIDLFNPSSKDAFELSEKYEVPLHPNFNLFWHDIKKEDLVTLSQYVKEQGKIIDDKELKLGLPKNQIIKNILIELGALHIISEECYVLDTYSYPLIRCCGLDIKEKTIVETERGKYLTGEEDVISLVSKLSGITIRARAPFRIGTRMGRPEKAAARKMKPPPHVLFPLGNYGGNQRLLRTAAEKPKIEVEAGKRRCPSCNKKTYQLFCTKCGAHTEVMEGRIETHVIKVSEALDQAKKNIKERTLPETIKGVIGTISKHKTPEPLEKGILRAKYKLSVFKDGTIRFDMTDAPLTHFKPKEIHVSLETLRKLGYERDYLNKDLDNDNQICELKVQDVIISKACAEYFVNITRFIDDLLVKFYNLNR